MDDAAIERIASAVASKIINQRLTELQAVREQAFAEGRVNGILGAVVIAKRHTAEIRALGDAIAGMPLADFSQARRTLWGAQVREVANALSRHMDQMVEEAAP